VQALGKTRIFEPLFTTKPKGRSTGPRLAMIFGAVKQAGGAIGVYSEVDRGTTFKVYLPRIEGPVEKLARMPALSDLPRGRETVLLVEDESSVRELSAAFLKRQGYKVLAARPQAPMGARAVPETPLAAVQVGAVELAEPGV